MSTGDPATASQRPERGQCSDFLTLTLSHIPSVFGRLVYLSSRRDPNTDHYADSIMSRVFGKEEVNRTLRKEHEQTFLQWLDFNLEQQKADLAGYFLGGNMEEKTVVEMWAQLRLYQYLLPAAAMEAEQRLFLTDLEILLGSWL
jgi:hypothetical protein